MKNRGNRICFVCPQLQFTFSRTNKSHNLQRSIMLFSDYYVAGTCNNIFSVFIETLGVKSYYLDYQYEETETLNCERECLNSKSY